MWIQNGAFNLAYMYQAHEFEDFWSNLGIVLNNENHTQEKKTMATYAFSSITQSSESHI